MCSPPCGVRRWKERRSEKRDREERQRSESVPSPAKAKARLRKQAGLRTTTEQKASTLFDRSSIPLRHTAPVNAQSASASPVFSIRMRRLHRPLRLTGAARAKGGANMAVGARGNHAPTARLLAPTSAQKRGGRLRRLCSFSFACFSFRQRPKGAHCGGPTAVQILCDRCERAHPGV